mmetsp:Transcript_6557/g.7600  ORF Transcript_6557/g.7600 Transcript_6557/m.7600 type:complete len:95 (+) Transcript_6557:479-763(+)
MRGSRNADRRAILHAPRSLRRISQLVDHSTERGSKRQRFLSGRRYSSIDDRAERQIWQALNSGGRGWVGRVKTSKIGGFEVGERMVARMLTKSC